MARAASPGKGRPASSRPAARAITSLLDDLLTRLRLDHAQPLSVVDPADAGQKLDPALIERGVRTALSSSSDGALTNVARDYKLLIESVRAIDPNRSSIPGLAKLRDVLLDVEARRAAAADVAHRKRGRHVKDGRQRSIRMIEDLQRVLDPNDRNTLLPKLRDALGRVRRSLEDARRDRRRARIEQPSQTLRGRGDLPADLEIAAAIGETMSTYRRDGGAPPPLVNSVARRVRVSPAKLKRLLMNPTLNNAAATWQSACDELKRGRRPRPKPSTEHGDLAEIADHTDRRDENRGRSAAG